MRMKPKVFTPDQMKAIKDESKAQTTENVIQRSTDPENYPVFDIPVNSKVLIYVPNHVEVDAETGEEKLRMDVPLFHTAIEGKRFRKIRCVRGLSAEAGYTGNCPFCEGEAEPWDLANEEIKEQCELRGLDPKDSDDESVKSIKRECYSKRVIKQPERFFTFPIVVIETDPSSIKKVLIDEETGVPKHKTYWYTIGEGSYAKKWLKTLEGMEDEPTHPGGEFFILNYMYESKTGEYNKRDSARELQVVAKKSGDLQKFASDWDKETEDWDVIKAINTIYDNMYYDEADLKAEVDKILMDTRTKLAIYQAKGLNQPADTGFQLGKPETDNVADDGIGGLPMADSIDDDEE